MVTKNNDELILEESLVESDEFVTKTMMKPDSFYESLESFTSDLQIFDVAGQKEEQNESDAEENMSFSLGNKIEHMVGEHTLKADRIWEPGGCLVKPDRQML
uniref:Uncharacterized protein n=1 Tax=Brassica campestris TaxID=3711 RepID=A0A3P6B3L4_BRACM|nr:unnamed protein product [Brassica rapa]